jgi:hypothetical protein
MCGNPRTVADTDRLCEKCRSVGQPHWAGTLLELRVTLESNPSGLDSLSYWREIRNFGRSFWEHSAFDKDPIQLLSDWLIAEHGKGLDCDVLCTPRREVAALLRAAVKGKQHTKPAHGDGNGGAGSTPAQPEIPSVTREVLLRQLEPAVRKAYLAYQYAETMKERRLENREAYDWLHETGIDQDKGDLGELTGYEVPSSFETFKRYVTEARTALNENKYTRRDGREHGGSIVLKSQIE